MSKVDVVLAPPNTLLRVDKLWAYLSKDGAGNEGLTAGSLPNGMLMPLIAADPERLKSITPMAERLATLTGLSITLVEFTTRTDLRTIKGKTDG